MIKKLDGKKVPRPTLLPIATTRAAIIGASSATAVQDPQAEAGTVKDDDDIADHVYTVNRFLTFVKRVLPYSTAPNSELCSSLPHNDVRANLTCDMSENMAQNAGTHEPASGISTEVREQTKVVLGMYILYLAALVSGITIMIGLAMAIVYRNTGPEWLQTHCRFLIRTVVIGLFYAIICVALLFVKIGILLAPVCVAWFIFRCAFGILEASAYRPIKNPDSWLFG